MVDRLVSAFAPPRSVLVTLLASCLALAVSATCKAADEPPAETWLRGADESLELRLHGEILDANGQPAQGANIAGTLVFSSGEKPIVAAVDGHRFEAWLPVNKRELHSVRLRAFNQGSTQVVYRTLMTFQLRQSAIDGVRMQLAPATQQVAVQVLADAKPVPRAWVRAELNDGHAIAARANDDGVATLLLLPGQPVTGLTAWNDDHRIGGYSLVRAPKRDAHASSHVVELEKCRAQRIRIVDDQGQPVAGIPFTLRVATPIPDVNYVGVNDDFRLTSDAQGNAVCLAFPDWEKTYQYVELDSDAWHVPDNIGFEDGVLVIPVKRNAQRRSIRAQLTAHGTSPAGIDVHVQSFQGERKHNSDETSRFTNADGSYELQVLPDATYCAYSFDSRWTGAAIDWIPFDSKNEKVAPPELSIGAGETLTVMATAGTERKPLANLHVNVSQQHRYSWRENGETRTGISGPHYWLQTDDAGQAEIHVTPGTVTAGVFTEDWRTEETIEVAAGQPATLKLHRPVAGPRTIRGQLVRASEVDAPLAGLEVVVGAVDGNFNDVDRVAIDANGNFEIRSAAQQLGFFVRTPDGAAAAAAIVSDFDNPVALMLRPTLQYHGQLLGKNGEPLKNHAVRAIVNLAANERFNGIFIQSFEAARIETRTDDQGRFTLTGVPGEMRARLHADALDGDENGVSLEEFYLEPGESRPPSVNRLAPSAAAVTPDPLAVRYKKLLRDCRLNGYGLMVVAAADSPEVKEFVSRYLVDYQENKNAARFMQFNVPANSNELSNDDRRFMAEQGWSTPPAAGVWAIACSADGDELGRLNLASITANAAPQAQQFVNQYAPPAEDAQEKWRAAFELAKQTDRRVWARMGGRYCGPCHRLSRWIDEHQTAIEKDYVLLKIDDFQDAHGPEVAKRITRGKHHGVPFCAIFDADEQLLIDGAGPLGNIGYPTDYEGKRHLGKMLAKTKQRLTGAEIKALIESID
ncbi:thioredoxin family protein [Lacipirellula sp.]|uniref:thioredoxin family protein n=1 Tax=Lacipirellula sp. TaxID=2691419 RepID=UPI003D0D2093